MEEMKYSSLLDTIMARAQFLCAERECSSVTRDYVFVAALNILDSITELDAAIYDSDDIEKTRALLQQYTKDRNRQNKVLEKWEKIEIPNIETMMLIIIKSRANKRTLLLNKNQIPANVFLSEILKEATPAIKELRDVTVAPKKDDAIAPISDHSLSIHEISKRIDDLMEDEDFEDEDYDDTDEFFMSDSMSSIVGKSKKLQFSLQDTVLGQQHAVNTFASGYFQSELMANIEKNRKRPRATFLFAGPPGVGKTFLSEEAARLLELPFRRFDMSEYSGPNSTDELSGSDANYKASSEGLLTGFVAKNPHCILLFDEIEKASLETIHLFLQVLDAGILRDNRTDEEVSFKDAILIFTTNAGKQLYNGAEQGYLSTLSRDVILNALSHDINPQTKEPYFPEAICSRFASGNVIMFNHLDAHSLRLIIEKQLTKHVHNIKDAMNIHVNIDDHVSTALLLSEGASADARTVKSRADSFFGGELYELFRLISAKDTEESIDEIKNIDFTVNHEGESERINALFTPSQRVHAIAYSKPIDIFETDDIHIPIIHYVHSPAEAKEQIGCENIQLILCDLFADCDISKDNVLNFEDHPSAARNFLNVMLERYPSIPKVIIESSEYVLTEEEKISYLRRGIRGFISLNPDGLIERIAAYTDRIFQQNCMSELARSNQLIRFETSQVINSDKNCAYIMIFDMKLEKAIRAEDADNVMSLLSTPDKKFDDIIGAEDAKQELQFFVSYMQDPKQYLKKGLSASRGILLYGPPGTGKTMLAKAFAAESKATFIATEGNQFFKGIVGQGAEMVHKLFATARKYAPSVIFIDEIDTIARARSGRDTDMAQDNDAILTALFSEMDGFSTNNDKPVFVLGATNYSVEPGAKMTLDPAILRRFDRRILIDLPSLENRKKFLQKEINKKNIFDITGNGLSFLADRSTGMSLAQLSSILDMAIRNAIQNNLDFVTDHVLEEAFEAFTNGESKEWNAATTLRTARHEAGHTLISWLSGEKPSYVTIVSRGDHGGYMQYADQSERMGFTKSEILSRITAALGGRAAEIVYYGNDGGLSTGASSDLRIATDLAKQMLCSYGMDEEFGLAVINPDNSYISPILHKTINELLKKQFKEAINLISNHKSKLDQLVNGLLECNSLKANAIDKIMQNDVQ